MAFLKFSRDRRGVENFYLVQPTTNRRGKVRPRVLYWFRSPPDVKVGREPFDPAVRRALEAQNPDVIRSPAGLSGGRATRTTKAPPTWPDTGEHGPRSRPVATGR